MIELSFNVHDEVDDEEVMASWYCDENGIDMESVTHGESGTIYVTCASGAVLTVGMDMLAKLPGVLQITYSDDRWTVTVADKKLEE